MAAPIQPKLRLQDRRRRLAWVKVAAGTSVVALALVLVFYVSHLPRITIAEVNVSGTNLVSASDVHALVSHELAGSYAFIVPHANVFVAPAASMRTMLALGARTCAHSTSRAISADHVPADETGAGGG